MGNETFPIRQLVVQTHAACVNGTAEDQLLALNEVNRYLEANPASALVLGLKFELLTRLGIEDDLIAVREAYENAFAILSSKYAGRKMAPFDPTLFMKDPTEGKEEQ